jgi:hypothetical protein
MDEEATIASLALHIVVSPILDQIEQKNLAAGQTLRSAFHKVNLNMRILSLIEMDTVYRCHVT